MRFEKRIFQKTACLSAVASLLLQSLALPSYAVTSGPRQPEFSSWSEVTRGEMVDLFTGDFKYSIPVLKVPGPNGDYPLTLSYRSGIGVEQEASWVGLGWTLNPGSISRQVRGLPDEFNAKVEDSSGEQIDKIIHWNDVMPSYTVGLGVGANVELYGADSAKLGLTLGYQHYFNNYRGFGWRQSIGLQGQFGLDEGAIRGFGLGLSFTQDSQDGNSLGISPSLSVGDHLSLNAGLDFHSTDGLSELSLGAQAHYNKEVSHTEGESAGEANTVETQKRSAGGIGVSFAGFTQPVHIPRTSYDSTGLNIALSVKMGASIQGVFVNPDFTGFFNYQSIDGRGNEKSSRPYGYLNLHEGEDDEKAVLDYHTEKGGPIWPETPNLGSPLADFDLFSVIADNLSGSFRAYRNDVPVLFTPKTTSTTHGASLGLEIAGGAIAHFGGSGSYSQSNTTISGWPKNDHNSFRQTALAAGGNDVKPKPNSEKTYYKFIGEPSRSVSFFGKNDNNSALGGDRALRVELGREWENSGPVPFRTGQAKKDLLDDDGNRFLLSSVDQYVDSQNHREQRIPRAISIEALSNQQILTYGQEIPGIYEVPIAGTRPEKNRHHTGAFVVTDMTGGRSVFAQPVYNISQEEYHFSVDRRQVSESFTEVINGENVENICEVNFGVNGNLPDYDISGTDKYLNVKKITPYVQSHLLTAKLGQDYSDTDAIPGPSDGDLGYWVKFDYKHISNEYNWRAPFSGAKFIRGTEQTKDDKGSVLYGQRELWYLEDIETKTHVARFVTSPREDARGVGTALETPTRLWAQSHKLDRIELYSKLELAQNPAADPLQTVHFSYTYELASGVPNNAIADGGKLTLRKLWTTFRGSSRGETTPYAFSYENAPYDSYMQDNWGNLTDKRICDTKRPYVNQDSDNRAYLAKAWNLSRIVEPAGGEISIDYESDDYSYVQDKKAMRLFPLVGLGAPGINSISTQDDRVYFPVAPRPGGLAIDPAYIRENYIAEEEQLYFRNYTNIKGGTTRDHWAQIPGYAEVAEVGYDAGHGWARLKKVDGYHPMAVSAWEYLRLEESTLINDNPSGFASSIGGSAADAMMALNLIDSFMSFVNMFTSVYFEWNRDGWGKEVELERSWVRLHEPDRVKFGGGSRVAKILVNDAWCENSRDLLNPGACEDDNGESNQLRGWHYSYTSANGESSGVTPFEPTVGGEENPLRMAALYSENHWFGSNNNLFYEEPINEGLYPASTVGYEKVQVTTEAYEKALEIRAAWPAGTDAPEPSVTGPVVHEFYTAKENPVVSDRTEVDRQGNTFAIPIPIPLIGMITLDTKVMSQGQSSRIGDLHGKLKKVSQYDLSNNLQPLWDLPATSRKYIYSQEPQKGIDSTNYVDVRQPAIEDEMLFGRSEDFYVEMNRQRSILHAGGVDVNVDTILAGIFPVPIPMPWPSYNASVREVKTVVTNKYIYQPSYLTEIIDTNRESRLATENLIRDGATGDVILSAVETPFRNPDEDGARRRYSYEIPAFWISDRMGAKYQKQGFHFRQVVKRPDPNNGTFEFELDPSSNLDTDLQIGDQLALSQAGVQGTAFVEGIEPDKISLKTDGVALSGDVIADFLLVRGIDRNMLQARANRLTALKNPLPMDQVSCFKPIEGDCEKIRDHCGSSQIRETRIGDKPTGYCFCKVSQKTSIFNEVLSIMATEFDNNWVTNTSDIQFQTQNEIDRFESLEKHHRNQLGQWRAKDAYFYVDQRSQSTEVDLSKDGTFDEVPLWSWRDIPPDSCVDRNKWRKARKVTRISPYGFALEEENALKIPKTALYGYQGSLPIATAMNAKNDEIGFEGFEEFQSAQPVPATSIKSGNIDFSTDLAIPGFSIIVHPGFRVALLGRFALVLDGESDGPELEERLSQNLDEKDIRKLQPKEVTRIREIEKLLHQNERMRFLPGSNCDLSALGGELPLFRVKNFERAAGAFEMAGDFPNFQPRAIGLGGPDDGPGRPNIPRACIGDVVIDRRPATPTTSPPPTEEPKVVGNKAHTGLNSFRVKGNVSYQQRHLTLENDKEYVFGFWVSRDDTDVPTYNTEDIRSESSPAMKVHVPGLGIRTARPSGPVIEGWQRAELTFRTPQDLNRQLIKLEFVGGTDADGDFLRSYFDDVRIHPVTASFASNVYDRWKYDLVATLDENNFATFFDYDEQGSQHLIRRETEKGILTRGEARSHLRERQ